MKKKMKMRFFYLLVINNILSHFVLYTPANLEERLYDGALVSILIALIINCINAYMVMYVYNIYKDNNLVEIHNILFGKFIGMGFSLIYLILNIAISFFMFRGLIEIIIRFMLPSTSIYLIAAFMIILPCVNIFNNEQSYLRYISLIAVIILFYTAIQILITTKNTNFVYIKGVFTHAKLKPGLISIGVAGYFFSGVSNLSVFNPVLGKLSWKKTCLLFLTLGLATASFTILIPVGVWGSLAVQKVQLVWVATSDALDIDLFLIERVLFILMPLFFMLIASQVLNYDFAGYTLIKIVIPDRKTDLIIVAILGITFIVLSGYLEETQVMLTYGTNLMVIAFCSYHFMSALLYIKCRLKEERINNEKAS